MLLKRCTQYASKFGKPSSGHRTGKRSDFIPILKKGIAQECSDYWTIMLTSHAGKVMLKTLQARLQQYMNWEIPDVQAEFRKGKEPEINFQHPLDHRKSKSIPEKHLFLFHWLGKNLDCVDHNKLWKILKEMGIPDHLSCLLRNLYAGQEATVRTGHGTADWFQIGKGVHPGCILSPSLFNLHAVPIMQNAGLDESQAGIKISERNSNNLRHAIIPL